jgi:serine/threonine protein kinase
VVAVHTGPSLPSLLLHATTSDPAKITESPQTTDRREFIDALSSAGAAPLKSRKRMTRAIDATTPALVRPVRAMTSGMPLLPGQNLGRYVIDGVIGHGGMGSVYRAHDTRLQRRVALKVLTADGAEREGRSTGGAARILREARIAAKLEHPNVVAIYDVDEVTEGEHAGVAYLAMELIEGRSLRACAQDASIPFETRLRWLIEVARGLAAAHDRGLVHRDVKPENVVVRADGVAKVLDFGIAKQLAVASQGAHALSPHAESVTQDGGLAIVMPVGLRAEELHSSTTGEGRVIGTPYYMSPEQMKGQRVDARTDQFSWGVLAYELLCGTPPWGMRTDPIHVLAAILATDPTDPHTVNPDVPEWLAAILMRTLAKSADARFASMHEVIARLEMRASGAQSEALAPSATAATALVPPRASTRRLRVPVLVAAVTLVVAFGVARWSSRDRSPSSIAPTPAAIPSGGCTSNAECASRAGASAICVSASCVALDSIDCHVKADPIALASNATLWVGSLYPLTGSSAEMGALAERATDLARQDFSQAASGLGAGGDAVRPIGVVSCDDAVDATRAAKHLVEELHVPAIVGFRYGDELIDLTSSLLGPHHVLAMATLTPSPLITEIPHAPGEAPLVWRATASLSEDALAMAAFVETVIEPQLRAEGAKRTRVALVRLKSPALLAFSERLFDALRFNGRSTLDNANDYQEVIVDPGADAQPAFDAALARLRDFAPNVVLYSGGEVVPGVLEPFERTLPTASARPRYVTPFALDDVLLTMVGTNADLRRRVFGLTLPSTTATNGRFTLHYNGVYGTNLSRADAPSTPYDGFYLVAYASLAMGALPLTGTNLAASMHRLVPPGAPVEVGPSGIFQAFTRLRAGESIDLVGAGGPLDFNLQTGENAADLSILCPDLDKLGNAIGSLESGLVYSAKDGALHGKMRCP